jgi:glutathione S-transferase
MILIGQYDSPFVRRVGIALRIYGMAFEHRPWSTFGDADKLRQFNPLTRVPTLVLDDGVALIESGAILDYLDELAGPERALMPRAGVARRDALRLCALATGLADKAVALVYERALHSAQSALWAERCASQIGGVLAVLEAARKAEPRAFFAGAAPGHADIALACALRFTDEAHPGQFDRARLPALARHAASCEGMAVFRDISQPFAPPGKG